MGGGSERGDPLYRFARPLQLEAHDLHAGLDRVDDDAHTVGGSMDHLPVTDVDTTVMAVAAHITWLWIADRAMSRERRGGTDTRMASRNAVAHETRAII